MLRPGLVSITFRALSPEQVIAACVEHGLQGIEWGGDVHVPAGDVANAKAVARQTADAGLEVAAYGSYYRVGGADPQGQGSAAPGTPGQDWSAVLDMAEALGAPQVRVWCGAHGSQQTDEAARAKVVADGQRIADAASARGIDVVAEWHGGTLTDTTASAESLLSAIGHEHFLTYWQPRTGDGFAQALDDLDAALPRLAGMHVFHWLPGDGAGPVQRRPLAEGQGLWPTYLRQAEAGPREADLFAMLEFVCDDDPANLAADAEALRQWTAAVNTAAARR